MTPRQRTALAFPVQKKRAGAHPRYGRVIGAWHTALTFEIFSDLSHLSEAYRLRATAGRVGVWHGRVRRVPSAPFGTWSAAEFAHALVIVRRLVLGAGDGVLEVSEGRDGESLHSFVWGAMTEVAQALRSVEGRRAGTETPTTK